MEDEPKQLRFFRHYHLYLMGMHETLKIIDEKYFFVIDSMGRDQVMLSVLYGLRQYRHK